VVTARARRVLPWLLPLALSGCASLPKTRSITPSHALSGTADTRLAHVAASALAGLEGPSAIHLMSRGPDAFLARLVLVEAAERCVDAQYYIWQDGTTGRLLLSAVLRAADRGVRVRLLIDDFGSAPNDRTLLLLDRHPNIEVRLFNPIASRQHRTLGMAGDFDRTNRRMHNKSLTVDNQVTVVGGRNIGDEYFEASSDIDFADLDALAVGSVVGDVSEQFDRYWNSPVVYEITELRKSRPSAEEGERALAALRQFEHQQEGQAYAQMLRDGALMKELLDGKVSFSSARVTLRADDPAKVERPGEDRSKNLLPQLMPEFDRAREQVVLVSPYFIPGKKGVGLLQQLRARGVRVRVLTNSLASTDEPPVFAAYKKYRRSLLESGVEIYEVDSAARRDASGVRHRDPQRGDEPGGTRARAALHGKVLVFDCREFFVGSMNLDPRSALTNTEVGIVVEAPDLAAQLCAGMDRELAASALRLELRPQPGGGARIEWTGKDGSNELRLTKEPRSSGWQRFLSWFYGLLPIEPLL
jgi:putative cardiolipin synthase